MMHERCSATSLSPTSVSFLERKIVTFCLIYCSSTAYASQKLILTLIHVCCICKDTYKDVLELEGLKTCYRQRVVVNEMAHLALRVNAKLSDSMSSRPSKSTLSRGVITGEKKLIGSNVLRKHHHTIGVLC
jgi:hypothetical protein